MDNPWEVVAEEKDEKTSRMRVPGGFIYRVRNTSKSPTDSMVFVPVQQQELKKQPIAPRTVIR